MLNIDNVHDTIIFNKSVFQNEEGKNFIELYNDNVLFSYLDYKNSNYEKRDEFIYLIDIHNIIDVNNSLAGELGGKKINVSKNIFKEDEYKPEICSCGELMKVSEMESLIFCDKCGEVTRYNGITNSKIFKNDGKMVNLSNNYKHKNYCSQIYRNIFALEKYKFCNTEKDKKNYELIKEMALNYCTKINIKKENLLCSWLRVKLSDLKQNKWLNHLNLLKKEITGYHPPRLNNKEENIFYIYYNIYQDIYIKLYKTGDEKTSFMRCEYVIYKILEQMLEDGERKNKILSHIFLPKFDTLKELDIKYLNICNNSNNILIYLPTEKGIY